MDYKEQKFSGENLSGSFTSSLTQEKIELLKNQSINSELLSPSLRRANLYFEYLGSITALLETSKEILLLGDVLYTKDYVKKEKFIVREAVLNSLFFYCKERGKSLLGYYLSFPSFSVNFRSICLGLTLIKNTQDTDCFSGKKATEIRRSLNLFNRNEKLCFLRLDRLSQVDVKQVNQLYEDFLRRKTLPKIGFLCAKKNEYFLNRNLDEEVFVLKKEGQVLAVCSGFYSGSKQSFYLDTFFSVGSYRQAVDLLLGQVLKHLSESFVKEVDFGLCPFAGTEAQSKLLFRFFYRAKVWYRPSGLYNFKSKYAKIERPVYLIVEKRRLFVVELFKLFWSTIYWK